MNLITELTSLEAFEAWAGAKDTKQTILNHGKDIEFIELINELYTEGLTATQLNDLLWFEEAWLFEALDIEA